MSPAQKAFRLLSSLTKSIQLPHSLVFLNMQIQLISKAILLSDAARP